MKKTIITLLGLVLAFSASVQAETLDELVAKLPEDAQTATQQQAISREAYKNPAFYQTLKGADWTFDGVKLAESYIVACKVRNKDWEAISSDEAARLLNVANFKAWVVYHVGVKGDTIAAYDWLQSQRLGLVGENCPGTAEKIEFIDALAAQILAAAKAKGD